MRQYCRYCAYCFDAGEFRCSNHPNGKQVYMTRADINRANKCPNYKYSDLGDVETGKQYHPLKGKRKKNINRNLKLFAAVMISASMVLSGCEDREANKVSYNISLRADNFDVVRRLTVINTRSDKCILQMTGKISIEDQKDGIAVLVELDRDKGIYQKHYIYMNENTMYTVEDVSGVQVSRYAYEMEFMPQSLVPVKITADELEQDIRSALDQGGVEVEE